MFIGLAAFSFALFLPISCSSETTDWNNAKKQNTVSAYEQFVKLHPSGVLKDSANNRIDGILYIKEEMSLGFFGRQIIRTEKSTGNKEVYGSGKWQPIIITSDGKITIPAGTQIVVR